MCVLGIVQYLTVHGIRTNRAFFAGGTTFGNKSNLVSVLSHACMVYVVYMGFGDLCTRGNVRY